MRSTIIAAGVAAAAFAFGAPAAGAKAPDVTRETNPYDGSFDCSEVGYDFTMEWEGVEHVVFKDRAGELGHQGDRHSGRAAGRDGVSDAGDDPVSWLPD